jgi:RNA polymerase sigma-70 factor (ECF subfamily)
MPAHGLRNEPDESLMLAYAHGAAAAFDELYRRHRNGVYRYLLRHCGNAGTADELFQDVWMNLIRARATYVPTARFAAWLFTLAHHRIVDHWRATGHAQLVSVDADDATSDSVDALRGADADEPEVHLHHRQAAARVRAALGALPPIQRDAFLLQHDGGLSLTEIATLTGVGVETVKSRLRYALSKLRADLRDSREGAAE